MTPAKLNVSTTQINISKLKDNNNTMPLINYPSDTNYELKCYATNYNLLIIKNGLAGIKYSN